MARAVRVAQKTEKQKEQNVSLLKSRTLNRETHALQVDVFQDLSHVSKLVAPWIRTVVMRLCTTTKNTKNKQLQETVLLAICLPGLWLMSGTSSTLVVSIADDAPSLPLPKDGRARGNLLLLVRANPHQILN